MRNEKQENIIRMERIMKIGIITYSKTGNTLSVAERIKESLLNLGKDVTILKVESINEAENKVGNLTNPPDVSLYDVIIFASPVHAFSLAPVMNLYLSQIDSLTDKQVYCFVTQHFKKPWLGGNRSVNQIKKACKKREQMLFGQRLLIGQMKIEKIK